MKKLFKDTLRQTVGSNVEANRFLDRGFMAALAKSPEINAKMIAKEIGKLAGIGVISNNSNEYADSVDYSTENTLAMPMMGLLKNKDSKEFKEPYPKRTDKDTNETFKAKVDAWKESKRNVEKENLEIHKSLLNTNWVEVMENFILQAAHYNAIQDNRYMIFFGQEMINKLESYVTYPGANTFRYTGKKSSDNDIRYVTKKDENLSKQYENWIRRLVLDQWKEPSKRLTDLGNIFQSIGTAKYMAVNLTGGIANVTVGELNVMAEAWAKDYFGTKYWLKGLKTWHSAIPSYLANMYKETSSSLPDALIKALEIVDFNEVNGVVHIASGAEKLQRVRNLSFALQSSGEHGMQNAAMFSMAESHRLVYNENYKENGEPKYKLTNEAEFIRDANEKALYETLVNIGKEELWNAFLEYSNRNANAKKGFVWFREDHTSKFARNYLTKAEQKQFVDLAKIKRNEAKKEFNDDEKYPTLMSQFKLGDDKKLAFKDGSRLQEIGDDAYKILGMFKNRVVSVNKKIHGVYDRLGAAQLEKLWLGGVLMQYHKHIYPGILKRWRIKGLYNEERGTIEKGSYISLADFLAMPIKDYNYQRKLQNTLTEEQQELLVGTQNLFKSYISFFTHITLNWKMLPDYEKNNIKRAMADVSGMLAAMCLAIGANIATDDKDKFLYNLAIHEADRLASESSMFNPYGVYAEGKKLWSSPVAIQGSISDALSTMQLIGQYITQGDDFDPYYKSGLFAKQNKFEVLFKRNIPYYHSYYMLDRLQKNNKYYKTSKNILGIVDAEAIADYITE